MSEINDIEEIPEVTFPINIRLIQIYKRVEPSIKAKYKDDTYHKGSFRGGSDIDLKLINITSSTKRTLMVRIILYLAFMLGS